MKLGKIYQNLWNQDYFNIIHTGINGLCCDLEQIKPKRIVHLLQIFSGGVFSGFDLTHSIDEGRYLSNVLKNEEKRKSFIKNTLKLKDYTLFIPNTGISAYIPIESINEKGLGILLNSYNPEKNRDCYFRIDKIHDKETINVEDSVKMNTINFNIFLNY